MGKFKKALKAIEGMEQIVKNEMITKGVYVSEDFDPSRSTAICQGHRYCAIGSLWAGAGVEVVEDEYEGFMLPGARDDLGERWDFLAARPDIALALTYLDTAAKDYVTKHRLDVDFSYSCFSSPMETLFEDEYADIGRKELLKIVRSAKAALKKSRYLKS